MKRKQPVYKGLNKTPVLVTDTSELSPEYFVITEFPKQLTAGKNVLKLRGNFDTLKHYSNIDIEILDSRGQPIYHEITNFVEQDKSRVISIYIYKTTPVGPATITLLTEASRINNAPVPIDWQKKYNVKWMGKIQVNPSIDNTAEIIFDVLPGISITEQVGVQLNRQYTANQFPTASIGKVQYRSINNQPILLISDGYFTNDMVGGKLTVANPVNPVPTPYYAYTSASYTTTIKKILNSGSALLDTEYLLPSTSSIIPHQYNKFDLSSYVIEYEETPQYTPTQNSESFALIKINNLQPATGDVSRLKVYINNSGTIGTWEQVTDIELEETEVFVTNTASLSPDRSIGKLTSQTDINQYYTSASYIGKNIATAPIITYNTSSLMNSMYIQSNIGLELKSAVNIIQITSSFAGQFIEDVAYKLLIDAYCKSKTGLISVYVSGSAFNNNPSDYFNRELPIKVGKRIGEISIEKLGSRIDDYEISFEADKTGNGVLIFVIEEGDWYLSDIRTLSDNDLGYTPNYTRIRSLVPTAHKSNVQLSFKLEYYNKAGVKCKQTSYVTNVPWQGGNRYIDGDYSMLTGSLYVADSLNSGIAISGYSNTGFVRSLGYNGFNSGQPGFLLWSGSAMSGSAGSKGGVPYSGVGLEMYANSNNYFRYSTSDSELDIRTNKIYIGNSSTFISASNGNLQISSSNFSINANGDVTASNIEIRGVSRANIIQNKSVTITAANSSSYLEQIPKVSYPEYGDAGGYVPSYYVLCLDGSLGGEIVQRVLIACACKYQTDYTEPGLGGYPPSYAYHTYPIAIAGIKFPSINDDQSASAIVEVSGSGVAFRDDIGGFGSFITYYLGDEIFI